MNLKYEELHRVASFLRTPPTIFFIFLLVALLELEESIQRAPTIRLLENAICQQYYRYENPTQPIEEYLCKEEPIQVKLAHIRGLLSLFDSLPLILFGSAFGHNADHNGRRIAFILAIFGLLCSTGWIYLTCSLWFYMPIELVWISSVFRLIGGGPSIAIAMCLTMASDVSTDGTRSQRFYHVYSTVLVTDLIGPLITFASLKHSLWLPFLICALSLLLTGPVIYFMAETLERKPETPISLSSLRSTGISKHFKFLKDWRILAGVVTVFLVQFRANTLEILLPYTSVRFGLEIGQAGTLLSIVSAVNLVIFLVILPLASSLLQKRVGWSNTRINIYVSRISSAMLALGAAILAAAPTLGWVIFGLIIDASGFGVRLSILAVLTTFVNSTRETGQLYTLVATTDAIAHMIASPVIQYVWSTGLQLGGQWISLPFVVLTAIFLIAFGISCLLREKIVKIEEATRVDSEREPLLGAHSLGDDR